MKSSATRRSAGRIDLEELGNASYRGNGFVNLVYQILLHRHAWAPWLEERIVEQTRPGPSRMRHARGSCQFFSESLSILTSYMAFLYIWSFNLNNDAECNSVSIERG